MEACSVNPRIPLHECIFSADPKYLRKNTKNPTVLIMINVWFDTQKYSGITTTGFSPVWANVNFKPGKVDAQVRTWKGLKKYIPSDQKCYIVSKTVL